MARTGSMTNLVVPFLFAFLLFYPLPEKCGAQMNAQTVTGIVTESGHLATEEGKVYTIAGKKAVEIQMHIGKKVQITGKIVCPERKGGKLEAENYKILQEIQSK